MTEYRRTQDLEGVLSQAISSVKQLGLAIRAAVGTHNARNGIVIALGEQGGGLSSVVCSRTYFARTLAP